MEYHRTKDLLHVKERLGHRNINNTLIYTHLVTFDSDTYTVRVAKDVESAVTLLEAGFEYVTDYGDRKLFRKRK
jgi:site-specific recombinase XerC